MSEPATLSRRGRAMSSTRAAIEAVLARATVDAPMDVEQIAQRAGVTKEAARTVLNNLTTAKLVHNTAPGTRHAKYAPGPRLVAAFAVKANDCPRQDPNTYTGAELRAYCVRPGAMDAFKLPSLQGGTRVEHRPPAPMSSSVRGGFRS